MWFGAWLSSRQQLDVNVERTIDIKRASVARRKRQRVLSGSGADERFEDGAAGNPGCRQFAEQCCRGWRPEKSTLRKIAGE